MELNPDGPGALWRSPERLHRHDQLLRGEIPGWAHDEPDPEDEDFVPPVPRVPEEEWRRMPGMYDEADDEPTACPRCGTPYKNLKYRRCYQCRPGGRMRTEPPPVRPEDRPVPEPAAADVPAVLAPAVREPAVLAPAPAEPFDATLRRKLQAIYEVAAATDGLDDDQFAAVIGFVREHRAESRGAVAEAG